MKLTWTLQRLNRTWFISPLDEQIVRIEHPFEDGATDEQWRALLRSRGIRIKNDSKPWGPLARRDTLNMLENEHPERMPRFFDSKEDASKFLEDRKKNSTSNEESKKEFEEPQEGA